MKRVLTTVLGASLLLAGCGQSSTPAATTPSGTPVATYGDGLDHSWTASTAEGQRLYAALSQGLKSQDFNIGLSVTATSGWGPIELNTSNGETPAGDGKPITLNGKVYSTGLGLHANSEIHVHATNLETPACTRFTADVGLDDEVGDKGSVVFQVFADGVKLFDSGVMTGASATQHVDVAIGNKSDLRFVVTDAGDNNYYDHADWAGAAITCVSATPSGPAGSTDTSFGVAGKAHFSGLGSPLTVQPDSSIILVSHTSTTTTLRRLTPTGVLDLTYGDAGALSLPASQAVALYPDGRIVLASVNTPGSTANQDIRVSRYLASGAIDASFGTAGSSIISGTAVYGSPTDARVDSNGAPVVLTQNGLLRFQQTGGLDTSFGTNGFLSALRGVAGRDSFYTVGFSVLPNGQYGLLSTQIPTDPNDSRQGAYAQYGLLEILSPTGQTLQSTASRPTRGSQGVNITSWPDGSVAASFDSFVDSPIKRLMPDGQVVTYQDTIANGKVIAAYGADKLVATRRASDTVNRVQAFRPDGQFDTSFANGGTLVTMQVNRFLVQPNGGILLVREDGGPDSPNEIERIFP